jgi:sRNA-binding protein
MRRDYRSEQVAEKQNSAEIAAEEKNKQIIRLLIETWPDCFFWYGKFRQPLKIGIYEEILVALAGKVTEAELSDALDDYVKAEHYQKALTRAGSKRIGLDGHKAGVVSPMEASSALNGLFTAERLRSNAGRGRL